MDQKIFATKHTSCLIKNIYFIKCTRWQRNGVIKLQVDRLISPLSPHSWQCDPVIMSEPCHVMMTGHVTIVITWDVSLGHTLVTITLHRVVYCIFCIYIAARSVAWPRCCIHYNLFAMFAFIPGQCLSVWVPGPASSPQQKSIQTSAYKLCRASLRLQTSGWRN